MNDGGRTPARARFRNAHAYLAAPYGVYQTRDGWLAIAMTPLDKLAKAIDLPAIAGLPPSAAFEQRDEIKRDTAIISPARRRPPGSPACTRPTFGAPKFWYWPALFANDAFRRMDMLQTLIGADGHEVRTTRSPIRINGQRQRCLSAAPRIGEHTDALRAEMGLST